MTQPQLDKLTKLLAHRIGEYRRIACEVVTVLENEKAAKELADVLDEAHAKYEPVAH